MEKTGEFVHSSNEREIIGKDTTSAEDIVKWGWMQSDGHGPFIVGESNTRVGVGFAMDENGNGYRTAIFIQDSGVYNASISTISLNPEVVKDVKKEESKQEKQTKEVQVEQEEQKIHKK